MNRRMDDLTPTPPNPSPIGEGKRGALSEAEVRGDEVRSAKEYKSAMEKL
jgi:hypothetical protein